MNIKNSPSGRILPKEDYNTFIPAALPPEIHWNDALISSISEASYLVGKLEQKVSMLPNSSLYMNAFLTREAVYSCKIEGIYTTLEEVLTYQADAHPNKESSIAEVTRYTTSLKNELDKGSTITLSLIKQLHANLLRIAPGEFRTIQNWIGKPSSTPLTAKYVPPPPQEMIACLQQLEHFFSDQTLPPLVHAALCHYQFEAIHPFIDGNGRVGRMLISLLLNKQSKCAPFLNLSAFFQASKSSYYDYLYSVTSEGNWTDWLQYFLRGISRQTREALSRLERIDTIITNWQHKVGTTTIQQIIKQLGANPYLTLRGTSDKLSIAFSTAQRSVIKLEDLGIVTQLSEGKRDRVYCATQIRDILEEPTYINNYIELDTHEKKEL